MLPENYAARLGSYIHRCNISYLLPLFVLPRTELLRPDLIQIFLSDYDGLKLLPYVQ
jgi:hypothetical protein